MFLEKSVKEIMSTDLTIVNCETKVFEAAKILKENKIGCLLVALKKGVVGGVISETDLVRKVISIALNPSEVSLKEIMSRPLVTIDAAASITEAYYVMAIHKVRHLIVTHKEKKVGLISVRDILYSKGKQKV